MQHICTVSCHAVRMASTDRKTVVGLDIGTTKIAVAVGEVCGDAINILGYGTRPSRGLRKGVVIHSENTIASVIDAVADAEAMADRNISGVYTSISGHLQCLISHGIVAVKNGCVEPADVSRVIEAAASVAVPTDRAIIHVSPHGFILDGEEAWNPVNKQGVRLEVHAHVVTAKKTSIQNLTECCQRCGLHVIELLPQALASGLAVLHEEEETTEQYALIDLGGGTTDLAIFTHGSPLHTSVLPVGGNYITRDIATGLRTPSAEAEKIKQRWGCAMTAMVKASEEIVVPSVGGRPPRTISRQVLCEIIEPRVEELVGLASREISMSGSSCSGAVITGGVAKLRGVKEAVQTKLGEQARCGLPRGFAKLPEPLDSPAYAAVLGLVRYGARHNNSGDEPALAFVFALDRELQLEAG